MEAGQKKIPFTVIALAVGGNVEGVNDVIKYFEPYINRLSLKTLSDECGNPCTHVDQEMKRLLETRLITAILKFDLNM